MLVLSSWQLYFTADSMLTVSLLKNQSVFDAVLTKPCCTVFMVYFYSTYFLLDNWFITVQYISCCCILGYQTLGEEYVNLVQIDSSLHRVPSQLVSSQLLKVVLKFPLT